MLPCDEFLSTIATEKKWVISPSKQLQDGDGAKRQGPFRGMHNGAPPSSCGLLSP